MPIQYTIITHGKWSSYQDHFMLPNILTTGLTYLITKPNNQIITWNLSNNNGACCLPANAAGAVILAAYLWVTATAFKIRDTDSWSSNKLQGWITGQDARIVAPRWVSRQHVPLVSSKICQSCMQLSHMENGPHIRSFYAATCQHTDSRSNLSTN